MCLLCRVDMLPQLFLLVPQRRLFLAPHRPARENHHNRLIALFLFVRRAARRSLILLPLKRAVLLAPLTTLLDRRHALRVVRFRLLPRAKDVALGYEGVFEDGPAGLESFARGFK